MTDGMTGAPTDAMIEKELRDGLRQVIASSTPPPPVNAATMLTQARRAHGRRRTIWAGAGTVTAVIAIAAGATAVLGSDPAGRNRLAPPASTEGPCATSAPATVTPTTSAPPQGSLAAPPPSVDTDTPWPTGPDGTPQQDRTAQAGPRHEAGARLLDELVTVLPPGFTPSSGPANPQPGTSPPASTGDPCVTSAPTPPPSVDTATPWPTGPDGNDDPWARYHQAQFEEQAGSVEVWEYLASLAIHQDQGQGVGRLFAEVHTPGNTLPPEPCELARSLWGLGGECQLVDAGGRQIGVVVRPTDDRGAFDQWAAYRHPDGTVVYVAQTLKFRGAAPGLPHLPFTVQQLADLATADRFHLQ